MQLQSNDGDSKALLYVVNLLIVPAEVAWEDKPREDNSGPGKNRPCGAVGHLAID